jgi:hypothetical protein
LQFFVRNRKKPAHYLIELFKVAIILLACHIHPNDLYFRI